MLLKDKTTDLQRQESKLKVMIDMGRLRQTVIGGIPCEFVTFKKVIIPPNPAAH